MSAKVYLVGIGPGQAEYITPRSMETIKKVSVVIAHPDTISLITELTRDKEVLALTQNPLERSRLAVEKAHGDQGLPTRRGGRCRGGNLLWVHTVGGLEDAAGGRDHLAPGRPHRCSGGGR